jgi:hypothetical protein
MKITIGTEIIFVDFYTMRKRRGNHATVCTIHKAETEPTNGDLIKGKPLAGGTSRCNPKDKYNKAIGKARALGRALSVAFPGVVCKPERMQVWERFFTVMKDCPDMNKLRRSYPGI